jgi:Ni/Fe-hydrogenase subunit HybB-like protein
LGGIAVAFLVTLIGVRVLPFLPEDEHESARPAGKGD